MAATAPTILLSGRSTFMVASKNTRSRAKQDQVDESGPDTPELPVEPVAAQFPAVDGTKAGRQTEVRKRQVDGDSGDRFEKVFSVGRVGVADDDPIHLQNAVAVVQEAIQRGLHPRGDVYLIETVENDELNAPGWSKVQQTDLRYAVDVVPASIDTEPAQTTTPSDLHDPE